MLGRALTCNSGSRVSGDTSLAEKGSISRLACLAANCIHSSGVYTVIVYPDWAQVLQASVLNKLSCTSFSRRPSERFDDRPCWMSISTCESEKRTFGFLG